jgi:hypothetical protein
MEFSTLYAGFMVSLIREEGAFLLRLSGRISWSAGNIGARRRVCAVSLTIMDMAYRTEMYHIRTSHPS